MSWYKLKLSWLGSLLVLGVLSVAGNAQALFIDKLLKSPSIEFPVFKPSEEVINAVGTVQTTYSTGMKTKNTVEATANNIRTAIGSIQNGDFTSLMDGSFKIGQSKPRNCTIGEIKLDVTDADSVANAINEIVFKAPHPSRRVTFDNNMIRFRAENVIEIYTAAQQLQLYMEQTVKPTLAAAIKATTEGSTEGDVQTPAPDANNEAAYNEAAVLETIDSLLQVLQTATALREQLAAVRAMRSIEPEPFELKDESSSSTASEAETAAPETAIETPEIETTAALDLPLAAQHTLRNSSPLAFARLSSTSSALTAVSDAESATEDAYFASQRKYLSQNLKLEEAPESSMFHPYEYEQARMGELDKLEAVADNVSAAISAHNMIRELPSYKYAAESYQKIKAQHQKAIEALGRSQQCVLGYIGRHYKQPLNVWEGAEPPSDQTAYDQMQGIAGWSLDAFDVAKAAQATTDVMDNTVLYSSDDDFTSLSSSDTLGMAVNPEKNSVYQEIKSQNTTTSSPRAQEQVLAENRETQLIPWNIGSEASAMLVASPDKWGTLQQDYAVWTDVKSFYNQYLNAKYDNIQALLQRFSYSDILAMVVSKLQGKEQQPSETIKQKEFAKLDNTLSEQTQELENDFSQQYQTFTLQRQSAVTALQRQRDAVAEELEQASSAYKNLKDEIADTRQQIKDDAEEQTTKEIKYIEPFDNETSTLNTSWDTSSPMRFAVSLRSGFGLAGAYLQGLENIKSSFSNKVTAARKNSDIDKLETQSQDADRKVSRLKEKLQTLNAQVVQEKLETQKQAGGLASQHRSELSALAQKIQAAKDAYEDEFAQNAAAGINTLATKIVNKSKAAFVQTHGSDVKYTGPTAAALVGGLNSAVADSLDKLYDQVAARIAAAKQQYAALGDNLYNPEYHEKVVAIHQQMIADIKAMALVLNYDSMGVASKVYLYETLLTADTSAEKEGYFVGAIAKERDLKAPMPAPQFKLPPLREMVYFDDTDFQNVKPYDAKREVSEPITKADFLNYGRPLPAIWQLLLQDKAFMERDVNLKALLNEGCTAEAFFRGGFMPCRVANSTVVVDVNADGEYIQGPMLPDMAECPYWEMRSGGIYDTASEQKIVFGTRPSNQPSGSCKYSELGTLLDADADGTIFFRQKVYDAFRQIIADRQKLETSGDTKAETNQKYAYDSAPLVNNQIGDYLRYAEGEQKARKNVEETKSDYDDMITTLKSLLAQYGYDLADDFDFSNAQNYENIRAKLDKIKNRNVSEAVTKIAQIKTEDNEVVAERVNKYQTIINALQKDKDELTTITEAVTENNNLDEDIKSSKVDEEVSKKYEEHLDSIASKLNLALYPFCANY